MKLIRALITITLLSMLVLCSVTCSSAEWRPLNMVLGDYTIYFEMPKPFVGRKVLVTLPSGRTPWEISYSSTGDDNPIKYYVRQMDMPLATWQTDGFNRRAVLDLGLNRETENGSGRIIERQDFRNENWPEPIQLAEELTVESADGKTIKHIRMFLAEGPKSNWAYVILSATRSSDSPRSPDIDRFFNSLKICNGDERPGRC